MDKKKFYRRVSEMLRGRPSMTDQNGRRVPFLGATFLRASKKGDNKTKDLEPKSIQEVLDPFLFLHIPFVYARRL